MAKTREGNEIFPADSPIRAVIMGNSNSLCGRCVHVADSCKGIDRVSSLHGRFVCVHRCYGFKDIKSTNKPAGGR